MEKEVAVPSPTPTPEVATIKYGLGYFDQIKERNASQFVSMAIDAGAPVERGVWAGGINYEKGKFNIGAIDYYSQDIINIAYAQGGFELPLATDWRLRFAGQYIDQGSLGDNELQGHSFSGHQFGIKVELPIEKALFTVAFTHEWGNTTMQSPWSGYPGYTSVQVQDFDRAGESAFLLRAGYDFPWVDGLSAMPGGIWHGPRSSGAVSAERVRFESPVGPDQRRFQGFVAASALRGCPAVWRRCP